MHQVGNCSLGDLDSQFEQLAIKSRRTPERVEIRHLKNMVTDLRADRRPPGFLLSRLKSPEQLKTLSVPPNDSFGFDDDQRLLPGAPASTKHDPEKTVICANLRLFLMTFPDDRLLEDY
jgi:hypothetical protein